ncbi:hypothetical protein PsorP6_017952 [Peronosclerospora sorghi]|uniref:Uncharacterized protein n=1 Tax=Peronosclerospora sorghi TaxID=230839 RepID=A0ACC0WEZ3_9STRA|nr:hypothetical protein PsorP6_017952 [Peronosclerospora sorghi]
MQNNNKNVPEFGASQPETVASGNKRPCKLKALLQRDQKIIQKSKHFTNVEYGLICTYLEDQRNLSQLFGQGHKTDVGATVRKPTALQMFETWICGKTKGWDL